MNEEGWGLKEGFGFIAIMCIAILITMTMYNRSIKDLFDSTGGIADKEEETYNDIENELINIAHTYTDNYYYKALEDGDEDIITIRDMQGENLLKSIADIKDENIHCSGYVYFKTADGTTTYKPYLKCGNNYQTDGYTEKYDEPVK